jgi:hypothetical protein
VETPLQIDFQGMQARRDVRDSVEKHVAELERRYGLPGRGECLPSMMPSSMHDDGCRIRSAVCRGRCKTTRKSTDRDRKDHRPVR